MVIANGKVTGWNELGIGLFTLYVLYPPYLLTVLWFSIACLLRRSANRWYWGLVGLLAWDVAVYLLYHFVLPHPTEPAC
ncbi:MAG: hypothetical protein K8T20_21035 [Planctomycetes bacterium]|nr:hypothetical protein [Planctomycetota bacterium]